jgi:DNA-binding transcriptional ArsR family regulator
MSRQCKACVSPSRRKIDRLLLEGQSFATIGRRFGLSDDTVGRHFRTHVEKALQKHAASERESLQRGARLQEQLQFISAKAEDILEQAQRAGNLSVALQALRELRESCRLAAVVAGELDDGNRTTVNVQINQQPADEARDARAYLEACNVPTNLIGQVMTYIEGSKPLAVIEGQAE